MGYTAKEIFFSNSKYWRPDVSDNMDEHQQYHAHWKGLIIKIAYCTVPFI